MIIAPLLLLDLIRDESGQDLTTYGLILGVLALALIASMDTLANFRFPTFSIRLATACSPPAADYSRPQIRPSPNLLSQ